MRTYVSPIGYDTRRVTRPVVNNGLSSGDTVHLLRPEQETDTERATQAVADAEQLLQEIEPNATCDVTRISTDNLEETLQESLDLLTDLDSENEIIVSFGGGARDILIPLVISAIVAADWVDQTLFFSDLDGSVQEWSLPSLTSQIPERTIETFEEIIENSGWKSLSEIANATAQSKSTIIRHVHDLEDAGIIDSRTKGKVKQVQVSFSGELLWRAIEGGG